MEAPATRVTNGAPKRRKKERKVERKEKRERKGKGKKREKGTEKRKIEREVNQHDERGAVQVWGAFPPSFTPKFVWVPWAKIIHQIVRIDFGNYIFCSTSDEADPS